MLRELCSVLFAQFSAAAGLVLVGMGTVDNCRVLSSACSLFQLDIQGRLPKRTCCLVYIQDSFSPWGRLYLVAPVFLLFEELYLVDVIVKSHFWRCRFPSTVDFLVQFIARFVQVSRSDMGEVDYNIDYAKIIG